MIIGSDFQTEVLRAEERIRSYKRETYFQYSNYFSKKIDGDVYFKLENIQTTGSFKVRGALNKLLTLNKSKRSNGVIAASTGNHGASVAYAARELDIECTIYVPKESSTAKINNMKNFGANIEIYGLDCIEAELKARRVSIQNDKTYVSPYNDHQVIVGQGTIGLEIAKQCTNLDAIIISVGGGGLISGVGSYLKSIWPNIKIIGCSPKNSAVMIHSIKKGELTHIDSKPTISDGTAGGVEDHSITFPVCCEIIDDVVLLTETQIKKAMLSYIKEEHLLLEGAAGVAVGALIKQQKNLKGKKVGVVICGGNISIETLKKVIK